jgi:hypothetical protein
MVTPFGVQPELLPSPQLNEYCTGFPWLEVEPLAMYSYSVPDAPEAGPLGAAGVDMTSCATAAKEQHRNAQTLRMRIIAGTAINLRNRNCPVIALSAPCIG